MIIVIALFRVFMGGILLFDDKLSFYSYQGQYI